MYHSFVKYVSKLLLGQLVAVAPIDEGLCIAVKLNVIFTVTGHHSNKFYLVKKN